MAPFRRFAADEDDASSPRLPRRLELEGKSAGENIGGGSLNILFATVGRCRERWRKGVLGIVGFMTEDDFAVGIAGLASEGLGTLPYEATSFCTAKTSGGGA